ncbi:MAG: DUF5615 family PIN-like protein [Actinomycetes bacterium]
MRFLLDNDVDATIVGLLVRAGHEAWTAAQAGLAGVDSAADDDVSVYAQDHDATVITHDREFTHRRKKNTFGRHLFMRCEQPDAYAILEAHLNEALEQLTARPDIVVTVSRDAVTTNKPLWE